MESGAKHLMLNAIEGQLNWMSKHSQDDKELQKLISEAVQKILDVNIRVCETMYSKENKGVKKDV
jgi:hypothetical protein